jgi:hypothetical protein
MDGTLSWLIECIRRKRRKERGVKEKMKGKDKESIQKAHE